MRPPLLIVFQALVRPRARSWLALQPRWAASGIPKAPPMSVRSTAGSGIAKENLLRVSRTATGSAMFKNDQLVRKSPIGRQPLAGSAQTDDRFREKWCCQTGLNCRPLHYQWSALPLSYGSVLVQESALGAPAKRGVLCH